MTDSPAKGDVLLIVEFERLGTTGTQRTISDNHQEVEEMTVINEELVVGDAGKVLHWYDFLCPFCHVGQQRNAILVRHGLEVVELPFRAHPDIPRGGIQAGPRNSTMYAMLEREAKEAGLPLDWPQRLPNTRMALAASEWTRQHQRGSFSQFHKELFEAHFALAARGASS